MKNTFALSVFVALVWGAPAPQSIPPTTRPELIEACCQDTEPLVNCIQIWPESCFCENDWIRRCQTQEGQSCPSQFFIPLYQDCTIEARAEVSHVPETFEELLEECACDEQPVCIQSWPESCLCRNSGIKKCEDKGLCPPVFFKPFYGDCSPLEAKSTEVVPVIPETFEELIDQCGCGEQPICIQSFPESCLCQNDYIKRCQDNNICPAVFFKPFYGDCSVDKRQESDSPVYQRCGSRGLDPCPEREICISDPFREPGDCGIACDRPGYCIPDKMCGGFAGFPCLAGQECVDDERDDCDPLDGGSDCAGLCFYHQL